MSVKKIKDYFLSQEEFELITNPKFGYLETSPIPENLDKYYDSENYISHKDSNITWQDKIYQFIKKYNLSYKFSLLKNTSSAKNLLDYGCGAGDFLMFAKSKNLNVFGVEPNQLALKITQEKIGKENAASVFLNEINSEFDYITLWHVLEHVPNLEEVIIQLKSKLKPNGTLYIAVPNYTSFDAKFYKQFWAAYDVPRHLWHFSPESLTNLFNSFGMKIEKRYPLWYDSFYVSLLSEKYMKSKFGIFRALLVGLISNLNGIFTGNYSSIVYQIRKNEN